jgi:HAD superfamily hydrolase (TIGR01509 family)
MIEVCIFDIGGVLIDTDDALLYAIRSSLLENNLVAPPDSQIVQYFGTSTRYIFKNTLTSVYKGNKIDPTLEKCYALFQSIFPEKVLDKMKILPDVYTTLQNLSLLKIKLACQTGFRSKEAHDILEHFNLLRYFSTVVTFDDVKKPRPDPEAMELVLKKLNIREKNNCLYIGDTVADIRFAKNSGVKIACITTGPQPRSSLEKEKPDYIVNNLRELSDLIR